MLRLLRRILTWSLLMLVTHLAGLALAGPSADRPFFVRWTSSGNNNEGVFFADAHTGWAVGIDGTILATRDGGSTWEPQKSGTDESLFAVHFSDTRTGWVSGAVGTILATHDGGATWEAQKSGTDWNLFGVHFADTRTGWAVGVGGTILATRDGGITWEHQKSGTDKRLYDVHFAGAHTGWVVGSGGAILATGDGGITWKPQKSGTDRELRSVYFANARTGWVVGSGGAILATGDGGITWEPQKSSTEANLTSVHFADARTGWAGGADGTILATRDGGATWEPQKRGTGNTGILALHFVDDLTGWAVGVGGTILATRDGGTTWGPQKRGTDKDLNGVHYADDLTGWAVGVGGTVLATRDGGATWEPQKSGTDNPLVGVHFADARTGWMVGFDGTILATRDGGITWEPQKSGTDKPLLGVHFADAHTGWAVGFGGTILATRDGGATWEPQKSGTDRILKGVHFANARTGWVVGLGGTILATGDGGITWEPQRSGTEAHLLGVHFADARTGWMVGFDGTILATRDGGTTWEPQKSGTDKPLLGVHFADAHTGWAVGFGGTILATRDGGATWEHQKSGTDKPFMAVHFAGAHTGWVVGSGGAMLRSGPPIYAPRIDDAKVASRGHSEVEVSFRVHVDRGAAPSAALVLARVGETQWISIGAAKKSEDSDGRWYLTWKPEQFGLHPGDGIECQVRLDDGGPPLAPQPLGRFTYDPWWPRFSREHDIAITSAFMAFALLLAYAAAFGLVLLVSPARLAYLGGAPVLSELPTPGGYLAFPWTILRSVFDHITLPWLCRHPRVRRAWTAMYRNDEAKLEDLGKSARISFLAEPEVLDAWVARSAKKVETALQQLDLFKQRQIYVELPVRLSERGQMIERPSAEALRPIFARGRAIVSIVGAGGTGKSTLACALARWAFASDPSQRLASHRMLPVFVVQESTNLVETVIQNLRRMLGDEELPEDLVRGLMAKQRLLVIVDALSERESETQRHVEEVFAQDVPLNAVVLTSRTEPNLGAVDRTALYPVRVDAARIVPFIIGYLDRMEAVGRLKDGRVQLQLAERILALAESAGRKTPVTPLLVTLFVDSAVRRALEGLSFDDMPEVVPEVFVDYLRRLNSGGTRSNGPLPDDLFIRAAQAVASLSLGKNLIPHDFSPQDAADVLKEDCESNQASALISRLVASGAIERRTPGGYVVLRFSLDPAAEYLAAIRHLFKMKAASREDWQKHLSSLEQIVGYPNGLEGYLIALATCYKVYKAEFSLPDVLFPWEGAPATSTLGAAISDTRSRTAA